MAQSYEKAEWFEKAEWAHALRNAVLVWRPTVPGII